MEFTDQIEKSEELSSFFQTVQDECTLANYLIFTDKRMLQEELESSSRKFAQTEAYRQTRYLMQVLKNHSPEYYDTHLLTKALLILSRYHCYSWR